MLLICPNICFLRDKDELALLYSDSNALTFTISVFEAEILFIRFE